MNKIIKISLCLLCVFAPLSAYASKNQDCRIELDGKIREKPPIFVAEKMYIKVICPSFTIIHADGTTESHKGFEKTQEVSDDPNVWCEAARALTDKIRKDLEKIKDDACNEHHCEKNN